MAEGGPPWCLHSNKQVPRRRLSRRSSCFFLGISIWSACMLMHTVRSRNKRRNEKTSRSCKVVISLGSQMWLTQPRRCYGSWGEQTWAFSGACLEDSYVRHSWREEGSRRSGCLPRITSKLRNGSSQYAGNQMMVAEGVRGWTRSSCQNSNIKRKHTGGRYRDRWSRRNRATLSMQGWG